MERPLQHLRLLYPYQSRYRRVPQLLILVLRTLLRQHDSQIVLPYQFLLQEQALSVPRKQVLEPVLRA